MTVLLPRNCSTRLAARRASSRASILPQSGHLTRTQNWSTRRDRLVTRAGEGGGAPGEPQEPAGPRPEQEPQPKRAQHPELEGNVETSSSIPDALPYLGPASATDWREFRARLVSQTKGGAEQGPSDEWAHIIPKPERGCLLLAHPLLFQNSQTYFHRAAILLLDHGSSGSYGVILNRPSKFMIKDVPLSRPQTQFADCRLYIGGDVGNGEVQVVHPYGNLFGAVEVVKGVYMGGLDAAAQAIDVGSAQPKDFKWFSAYAGWAPGQLDMECKRGVWFTAAGSPKLLLQDVEVGQGPKYWHKAMALLGGDYADLSKAVADHDELDPEGSSSS